MNRRQFLKKSFQGVGGAALSYSSLGIFLSNLVQSQLNRAYALGTSGESAFLEKKLINIVLSGGAPRNFFDLPLNPDGSGSPFTLSPLLANKLVADASNAGVAGYRGVHETIKISGYEMPYFWSGKIPTPNNGSANVSSLASNMIVMRGLSMVDLHEGGRSMQLRPNSGLSLDGMVADRSSAIFPVMGMGANGVPLFKNFYRSKSGVPFGIVNGRLGHNNLPTSPLATLFDPFLNKTSLKSNSATVGAAMDIALEAMREHSGDLHKMIPSSFQQRQNAKTMMQKSFGNLADAYNVLYAKYKTLMDRALFSDTSLRMPGVDDLSLNGIAHDYFRVKAAGVYYGGDLKDSINANSYIENLASSMAITEYLVLGDPTLSESFTSAAHLMIGHIGSFNYLFLDPNQSTMDFTLSTDSHQEGAYVQLVHYARYYRAIAACTYELIQKLKSRDRFKDTVITLTSEFHRLPRADGSGSDHGHTGSVYSLFTGMTDQLQVYGDIKTPSGGTGTWGLAATVPEFGGQTAVLGNAVSSVCSLLDLPTPATNNPPFFTKDTSTGKAIASIKRRPRNDPAA